MDTNIVNIKSVLVSLCFHVLSNTLATFGAQFMKKLSNTEAELKKKRSLYKKKSVYTGNAFLGLQVPAFETVLSNYKQIR